ncbi:hypothetical protein T03_16296 [Trichinella britovi]|uniref:Uncharacterized protein n=1 Tax=Trichinella britovi TaxID=45882 RepID=A0A0V1CI98_TRIBR|nr:hypothetical protein T03_16296 [Trichinella britovi]
MGPCGVVNYTLSQICLSVTYDATSDICFGFRRLFVAIVSGGIVIFNTPHHYFFNIHPFTSCPCPSGQTFVAENKYCEPSKFANFTLRAGWLSSTVWLFSRDEMENCRNTKNPPPSTTEGNYRRRAAYAIGFCVACYREGEVQALHLRQIS